MMNRWIKVCIGEKHRKWFRILIYFIFIFASLAMLIGFILPDSYFKDRFQHYGSIWLGVLMYSIVPVICYLIFCIIWRITKKRKGTTESLKRIKKVAITVASINIIFVLVIQPLTQIYNIATVEEALKCVELGVDNIGSLVGGDPEFTSMCTVEQINAIYDAVGRKVIKVLIPYVDDPKKVLELCELTHPDVCHLTLPDFYTNEDFYKTIHRRIPGIILMQAIPMSGPEALDAAKKYSKWSDWLILDSVKPNSTEIGAAGFTHDWNVSKAIVEKVHKPIILAGGLGPDNVRAAIETVKPFGVDSLTRTSYPDPKGGPGRKNFELVKKFVEEAKAARP